MPTVTGVTVAEWWTTQQVAEHLGLQPVTVRKYRSARRPLGNPFPPPDRWLDQRTPLWRPATIRAWQARRVGRGNWDRRRTRQG